MTEKKGRFGLDLDRFKPTPKKEEGQAGVDEVAKVDEIANQHGFTSREGGEVKGPKAGRPVKTNPRRQLNFIANVDDYEWWVAIRDERGVNGAKLFKDMRAAYEKIWIDRE